MPVIPPMTNLLYVYEPPLKVRAVVEVLDKTIVEVPESRLTFPSLKFHTVPVPVTVHVPDPIFRVLAVDVALSSTEFEVTLYETASKIPDSMVSELEVPVIVNAPPNWVLYAFLTPAPADMTTVAGIDTPLVVMVCVPRDTK